MKKIKSALISVFYKDGLEKIVQGLASAGVKIYSTGGTQSFIESLAVECVPVESLTNYPSILGGRVKTLHPAVFGGILGRRDNETDIQQMRQFNIPEMDLVIVDLYPFEETVKSTSDESQIIEKIDVGGPSMIRAAAKNYRDVVVVASKSEYGFVEELIVKQDASTTLEQRRELAKRAFDVCSGYDIAISSYFNQVAFPNVFSKESQSLRYGENPHQNAKFFGSLDHLFVKLNGKDLSYNNLVDVDAAMQLLYDLSVAENKEAAGIQHVFAIIKHTNVCGVASRDTLFAAWSGALAGDPESAFGGILICNSGVDEKTALAINEIFFEVLIAPAFDEEALKILTSKKNRILLKQFQQLAPSSQIRSLLGGTLLQDADQGNIKDWNTAGTREVSDDEKQDLLFANIVCKHLKSNAITIVKNKQLIGKGCGQTSRIDALRHAIEKAKSFNFDLKGAVLASDAFFPFDDCVKLSHQEGISAFIQPGGSIRDEDSNRYCRANNLAMVLTGIRHFRH
jgi:phosphoribosylaminoimidazolecarboxamide formyltransferase / IMP cyclohydrolase